MTGPLVLGLLLKYPCDITVLLAGMALVGCVMDWAMVHRLRRFDADLLFVDHLGEPAFDGFGPLHYAGQLTCEIPARSVSTCPAHLAFA